MAKVVGSVLIMEPAKLDLPAIWRGCDWNPITFQWKNINGDPFDLTGWYAYASTNEFNLNAQVVDATHGITQISMTRDLTVPLKVGIKRWSWVWEYVPNGVILPPYLSGNITVKQVVINVP